MKWEKISWSDLALNLAVFLLYLLATKIGLFFALDSPSITIFWPAGGLALAILLLSGLKCLPGIFVGAVVAGWIAVTNLPVAVMLGVADTLESAVAYWILTRYLKFDLNLTKGRDFFNLALVAGPLACIVSTLIGPSSLLLGGIIPSDIYPAVALRWWMGDVLGIVFMTPLILVWVRPRPARQRKRWNLEMAMLFALAFLVGQGIFNDWHEYFSPLEPSIAWVIPLVIWSGLRGGRRNTAALQLMIFVQSLWGASHGVGRFAHDMAESGLLNFWIFGAVVALGGMALAIVTEQRDRAEAELRLREKELAEKDERLQLTLRAARQGWFDLNLSTGEAYSSDEYPRLLGFEPAEFQSSLQNWKENIHPDDYAAVMAAFQECLSSGGPVSMEYRRRTKNGEWLWLNTIGEITEWGPQHQALRMIGIHTDIDARKQAMTRLEQSERRVSDLIQTVDGIVWEADAQTFTFTFISHQAETLLGYPAEAWLQPGFWVDHLHPDDKQWAPEYCASCTGRLEPHDFEYRFIAKDNRTVWLHDLVTVVAEAGAPRWLRGLMVDITERKMNEERLQLAAKVFSHAREGILITDAENRIVEINATFTQITGYSREEVIGMNPRLLQSGRQSPDFYAAMWESLDEKDYWTGEIWNRRKNGEEYAELLTISTVRDKQGKTSNYVAVFSDITRFVEYQQELERIAHFDALTNLPNRVLFSDRLRLAIAQCQRRNLSLAVVYLDLDGFKAVNDLHGHGVGDSLLITVAQRMKHALREGDTLARFGGDEFVAVLVDLENRQDYIPILERLLQAAAEPVMVEGLELNVSASIGLTLYPQDWVDADLLLRHADYAMYIAKQAGKNRYQLFEPEQNA